MSSAGAEIIQSLSELQIIGTLEVVPKLLKVYTILKKLKHYFAQNPPALCILIDFPDFHFLIGKFLKKSGVPVIYFVSPQIWAWRPSRITTIKKFVHTMIPLYEFEYNLYKNAGVPAFYCGHPLLDIVKPEMDQKEFCRVNTIPENAFTLTLMPGSRISEINKHMPTLLTICHLIKKKHDVSFLLIKAPSLPHNAFSPYNLEHLNIKIIEKNKYAAMKYSHLLLMSSGTATVEACITETPMIVFYKLNQLSWIVGKWLVTTRYLAMVNILANKEIVPEFYQNNFKPQPIAELASQMIANPHLLKQQTNNLIQLKKLLGAGNASHAIAEFIVKFTSSW